MTKNLLGFLTILSLINNGTCQELGLKFGGNFISPKTVESRSISNISFVGTSSRLGLQSGLLFKFRSNSKFHLSSELLYSLKGYSLENPSGDNIGRLDYHYLGLAPRIDWKNKNLTISGSVLLNYLLADNRPNVQDFIETRNIELNVTLSASYRIAKNLDVEFSYNLGLTPFQELNAEPILGEDITINFYHRDVFQISLIHYGILPDILGIQKLKRKKNQ